ncbi:IS110 family transposase [Noviherbaspirillum sedimenti]|uniref:IS110 family transposase n=1 Tax=Noviherbaspirillum sedimenti TaxID=2320865 RepID=A0A3A3G9J9_9BURK|nr:IS110 family transposase [Noviherbaspirillum sedimenti]RJG04454.1 IS110 family transposase [Noviherbaspirillum sedimenti]
MAIVRIGLDIAKLVFQVHGVDEHGKTKIRKTLSRGDLLEFFAKLPPCLVGIEACGGAHYWARELGRLGHDARLMASQFVIPYRKSGKNDANDAEAICEAVGRPNMRFVPVKSEEAQAILTMHRARDLLVSERIALSNQIGGLLGEFGIAVTRGMARLRRVMMEIQTGARTLPLLAKETICELYERMQQLEAKAQEYERKISAMAKQSEAAKRLMAIEGVGPITATAIVASVGDARLFRNGREFAAWLGLTPRQHSSGGKSRLGGISKRGDVRLRTLLIHRTRSVMRSAGGKSDRKSQWAVELQKRSCSNVAAVALAAKHARIMWAMLAKGTAYRTAA